MIENLSESDNEMFRKFIILPVSKLIKAEWNYKVDDEQIQEKLDNSITKHGQIQNCQVREIDNGLFEVIDGNHRLNSFRNLGKTHVMCFNHGKISEEEAKIIAINSNEIKFDYDPAKLSALLTELQLSMPEVDIRSTLPFNEEEWTEIFNPITDRISNADENHDLEEDNFEAVPPIVPYSKTGDIYDLGKNRLMCGDSTSHTDALTLMNNEKAGLLFTDPPYNVNYAEFNANRPGGRGVDWSETYCNEWSDRMSESDYFQFLCDFIEVAKANLIEYAHYYIFHASKYFTELTNALNRNEIKYRANCLLWLKQVAPMTWANYRCKYEPFIFAGKDAVVGNGEFARWFGPVMDDDVWEIARDHNGNYVHPTQKPLALAARAIRNSSLEGEIVLDLFGGSGSTLLAADMMNRRGYLMEMEPKFVDVIVKRYINYCNENNKAINIKKNGIELDSQEFLNELERLNASTN